MESPIAPVHQTQEAKLTDHPHTAGPPYDDTSANHYETDWDEKPKYFSPVNA